MTAGLDAALRAMVGELVDDLVAGRYARLAGRVSEAQLRRVVDWYGATLVPLPASAWNHVDVYLRSEDELAVDVPLWCAEDGRSDLLLSLTAAQRDGVYALEVVDFQVA